jgi:hypothetical protein
MEVPGRDEASQSNPRMYVQWRLTFAVNIVAGYLVTRQITRELWNLHSVYQNIRQAELPLVDSQSYST